MIGKLEIPRLDLRCSDRVDGGPIRHPASAQIASASHERFEILVITGDVPTVL